VSTTTGDTRNTGDGTTGTPGLGRSLVTSLLGDSVGLAAVLVHAGVNGVDNVRADGRLLEVSDGSPSILSCSPNMLSLLGVLQNLCLQILQTLPAAVSLGPGEIVTDLEDIGDGNGVLGGLALGGDDGDGRPRHGGCCGRCLVVSIALESEIVRMKNGFVCGQAPWRHVPKIRRCASAKTISELHLQHTECTS
jgi:hypothetical protein